jgi:hypothetical protein
LEKIFRRIDQHTDQNLVKIDVHVDKSRKYAIRDVREEEAQNLGALQDLHYKASKGLNDQRAEILDVAKYVNKIRTKARDEQDRYDNSAREREKADMRQEQNARKRKEADMRHEENKMERIRLDALHIENARKRADDEAEQADEWEGLENMLKRNEALRQAATKTSDYKSPDTPPKEAEDAGKAMNPRRSYRERNEAWERRRSTSAPHSTLPWHRHPLGIQVAHVEDFVPLTICPHL